MPIYYENGNEYKVYQGDRKPCNLYMGEDKIAGYHEVSDSGESASFSTTYNDIAEVLVHGNTVQKSDYYIKEGLSSQYQDTKTSEYEVIQDGLMLEFSGRNFFNDPQTALLQDRSGNGNAGTPMGFAYNNTSGSDGNGGIVLDGVDDVISVENSNYINPTSAITCEASIYIDSDYPLNTSYNIFGRANQSYRFRINTNGTMFFLIYDGTNTLTVSTSYKLPSKTLTHVCVTFDTATQKATFYVNGIMKEQLNLYASNITVSVGNLAIGSYFVGSTTELFKGTLYSCRIYNRALTDAEVLQNYNAGINLNIPSPIDQSPILTNLKSGTYKYTSTDGVYEFTLDDDLRGIDTTVDKIVFDRVSHKGYIDRKYVKYIFDGSADEYWVINDIRTNTARCRINRNSLSIPFTNTDLNIAPYLCDKFKAQSNNIWYTDTELFESDAIYISFRINLSRLSSQDSNGVKNWLSSNSMSCICLRLYPIHESLTFTNVASSTKTEVPMEFIDTTPSLDYPAEVYDVVGYIKSRGKNVIDFYNNLTFYILDPSTGDLVYNDKWRTTDYYEIEPNTIFSLSEESSNFIQYKFIFYDDNRTFISGVAISGSPNIYNITTPINCRFIRSSYSIWVNDVYITRVGIQLEKGIVATKYEPYVEPSVQALPVLRKVGDIEDTYEPKTGEHIKRISDWIILDGSRGFSHATWSTSKVFKEFYTSITDSLNSVALFYKYNSKELSSIMFANQITDWDSFYIDSPANLLYLRVKNDDTGFSSSYSPTKPEIQAYFYGWKMYNSDGTSPYYKSEIPYAPETWEEWTKDSSVATDSTGITITGRLDYTNITIPAAFKASTNYGLIYEVVSSNLISSLLYRSGDSGATLGISKTAIKTVGKQKIIMTTGIDNSDTTFWMFINTNETSQNSIKLKNIRIFELPIGSQIESDFNALTADELDTKYTFNGLCEKNWKHVTDGLGQTNILPTASYDGYIPYKGLYQLATPIVTQLTPQPLLTYYPSTMIETDCVNVIPAIDMTVKVED